VLASVLRGAAADQGQSQSGVSGLTEGADTAGPSEIRSSRSSRAIGPE
jgi:hypothetical protein